MPHPAARVLRALTLTVVLASGSLDATPAAAQQALYWTDGLSSISRAHLDGADQETLVSGRSGRPNYLAYDGVTDRLYWTEYLGGGVFSAAPDGSTIQTEVAPAGARFPSGLVIDSAAAKIYWLDLPCGSLGCGRVRSADLPGGTNQQTLYLNAARNGRGLALDTGSGTLYWADANRASILRGPASGVGPVDVVSDEFSKLFTPEPNRGFESHGMTFDSVNSQLYFTVNGDSGAAPVFQVRRKGPDFSVGAQAVGLVPASGFGAREIALDVAAGVMYWSFAGGSGARIVRANLDGTGVTNVVTGLSAVYGLELGPDFTDPDADGDTVPDVVDNCPNDANTDQADIDLDGAGDACDSDGYTPDSVVSEVELLAADVSATICGAGVNWCASASSQLLCNNANAANCAVARIHNAVAAFAATGDVVAYTADLAAAQAKVDQTRAQVIAKTGTGNNKISPADAAVALAILDDIDALITSLLAAL